MTLSAKLDRLHSLAKQNKWLRYFSVFIRIALAAGFILSGIVKILGERFASGLSVNHPMGHYLEALHHTGYYYTFIGVVQIIAAILLLIPMTVTLAMSTIGFGLEYMLLNRNLINTFNGDDIFAKAISLQTNKLNNTVEYSYDGHTYRISILYKFGNKNIKAKQENKLEEILRANPN